MSDVKKERWTEAEVLNLPPGEHDKFERKSGALLNDLHEFRKDLAKALSAFANSGGGHIVLGVDNAGAFDGLPPIIKGRTPTREWLEQVIPHLLDYSLDDFRVHEVEGASPSNIPSDKVAIVIDVGDSALAPHQTEGTKQYYYRQGGHSTNAPHFYLETLRNRLVKPSLSAELIEVQRTKAYESDGGVFVETLLRFRIKNIGRIAAYKWELVIKGISGDLPAGRDWKSDYRFNRSEFPRKSSLGTWSPDKTILPGLTWSEDRHFGFHMRAPASDKQSLLAELRTVIPADMQLDYRVATETSPGELKSVVLRSLLEPEKFVESLFPLD